MEEGPSINWRHDGRWNHQTSHVAITNNTTQDGDFVANSFPRLDSLDHLSVEGVFQFNEPAGSYLLGQVKCRALGFKNGLNYFGNH